MSDVLSSPDERQDALNEPCDQPITDVRIALSRLESEYGCSSEKRQQAIEWLEGSAHKIVAEDTHVAEVLNRLIRIALDDHYDRDQRNQAWKTAKVLWRAGWDTRGRKATSLKGLTTGIWRSRGDFSRRLQAQHRAIFSGFLLTLRADEDGDLSSYNIAREAADELGLKATDIAQYDEMINQAVQALIDKTNSDEPEIVRRTACINMGKILDAAWENKENQESRRQAILDLVLRALVTKGIRGRPAWFVRQASANWLGSRAEEIAADARMLDKALDALIERANDRHENNEVRHSAREASKSIWEAGWDLEGHRELRRPEVLEKVISALQEEDDDPQDWQFRQAAAAWLGEKSIDLAQDESMARRTLEALIERTRKDSDEYIRRSAERAIRENWDAGWVVGANLDDQRQVVLDLVLNTLEKEGNESRSVRQVAASWLQAKAADIAGNEMMLTDTLVTLLSQSRKEEVLLVRRSIREASEQLWDEGWKSFDLPRSTNEVVRTIRRTDPESREKRRVVVVDYILKTLKTSDAEFRLAATRWLDRQAGDIAKDDRMVVGVLSGLLKNVDPVFEPDVEVRRAAREASVHIWNGAWKHEINRHAALNQVLKALKVKSSGEEILELKQWAINWLGDKERVEILAANYEMAEQAAQGLITIKRAGPREGNLRDSALRSLMALWEQLRKRREYKPKRLNDILSGHDEEAKVKIVQKLANEGTLGGRDNVNLLIEYWVKWIGEEREPRLVELTAERLRENDHAVLPLVENFATRSEGAIEDDQQSAKKLRVRRRIARQLAYMSDPRYIEDPERRASILDELREYAVPVLVQRLADEQDVEVLENIACMLAYTREREAISALAREVVGDSRERKARQELLATYYLEPTKYQNQQAADILENAIGQARGSLRLLRVLNALVVLIGLGIVVVGLYSLFDDSSANRIPGLFAAFGGGAAVVLQFIRRPMIRIQNANSNLVQMETAFTSFIWELNLNGTFIQSSYVKDGQLQDYEIDNTLGRIEGAMKSTMNLVSSYTKTGNQMLVTRINRLEPAAGLANMPVTIYGQHLLGDTRGKRKQAGRPVMAQAQKVYGDWAKNGQGAATAAGGAREREKPAGIVALNHRPINLKGQRTTWDAEKVTFKLPGGVKAGIVWVSLFVDGMETNALPFQVLEPAMAKGAQK